MTRRLGPFPYPSLAHVSSLLADEDRDLQAVGGVQDLSNHAIFDRGRLIGLWEFDPGSSNIAWRCWVPATPELKAAVARTEAFARNQLGDVRSFSLDSPESRQGRIEALRAG